MNSTKVLLILLALAQTVKSFSFPSISTPKGYNGAQFSTSTESSESSKITDKVIEYVESHSNEVPEDLPSDKEDQERADRMRTKILSSLRQAKLAVLKQYLHIISKYLTINLVRVRPQVFLVNVKNLPRD